MVRVSFYVGIGCAILVVFGGLIGLSVLQILNPDDFPSAAYSTIEDLLGFLVLLFLVCSAVTWAYAYKLTKSQWSTMDSEQKMARVLLMSFAFYFIGYFLYYRGEIRRNEQAI